MDAWGAAAGRRARRSSAGPPGPRVRWRQPRRRRRRLDGVSPPRSRWRLPPDEGGAGDDRAEPERAVAGPQIRLRENEEAAEGEQSEPERAARAAHVALAAPRPRSTPRATRGGSRARRRHTAGSRCRPRGERRERDAIDQRVDVEVAAEPGGHPAEPAAVVDPGEPPGRRLVEHDRRVGRSRSTASLLG